MKRWAIAALVVLTAAALLAGFLHHPEHGQGHWWDSVPGFFIFFGFAGCALLIIFSKALGKVFLLKKEDYYEKPGPGKNADDIHTANNPGHMTR